MKKIYKNYTTEKQNKDSGHDYLSLFTRGILSFVPGQRGARWWKRALAGKLSDLWDKAWVLFTGPRCNNKNQPVLYCDYPQWRFTICLFSGARSLFLIFFFTKSTCTINKRSIIIRKLPVSNDYTFSKRICTERQRNKTNPTEIVENKFIIVRLEPFDPPSIFCYKRLLPPWKS